MYDNRTKKKIQSFSLEELTIRKITSMANVLGISRSKLLDLEIERRLAPLMPLVENIRKEQLELRRSFDELS